MKSIKEEANEIIRMFKVVKTTEEYSADIWGGGQQQASRQVKISKDSAIQCGIIHVERMLEELNSINHKPEYVSFSYKNENNDFQNAYERIEYYESILIELKSRL